MSESEKDSTIIITADPEYMALVTQVADKLTAAVALLGEVKDLFTGSLKHSLQGADALFELPKIGSGDIQSKNPA